MSSAQRTRFRLALAASLAASALAGCGGPQRSAFCGLAYPGFEPVRAVHGIGCDDAIRVVAGGENGWTCSRAMHAAYELDCRSGRRELQILEGVPARAQRHGAVVELAGWSFRVHRGRLQARRRGRWLDLGARPFCVDRAPRPALVALRLRPATPHGGCFR